MLMLRFILTVTFMRSLSTNQASLMHAWQHELTNGSVLGRLAFMLQVNRLQQELSFCQAQLQALQTDAEQVAAQRDGLIVLERTVKAMEGQLDQARRNMDEREEQLRQQAQKQVDGAGMVFPINNLRLYLTFTCAV